MNFKKIITFIVTSSFIGLLIPVTTVRAKDSDSQVEEEMQTTIEPEIATEVSIDEYVYWEVELENMTLNGYTQNEYGCLLDASSCNSTKDLLDNISEETTHDRILSIVEDLELPEECPLDLHISYYVQKDGSITDITCDYTERDSDEEELTNKEDEELLEKNEAVSNETKEMPTKTQKAEEKLESSSPVEANEAAFDETETTEAVAEDDVDTDLEAEETTASEPSETEIEIEETSDETTERTSNEIDYE